MRRRPCTAWLCLVGLALTAQVASAQNGNNTNNRGNGNGYNGNGYNGQLSPTLGIGRLGGEIGGTARGWWYDTGTGSGLQRQSGEEWLELRMAGFAVHPDVVSFTVRARPSLRQGRIMSGPNAQSSSAGGDALQGAIDLRFFGASEISGATRVSRSRSFRRGQFGSWNRSETSLWSAELVDKNPLLPARLEYTRQGQNTNWLTTGRPAPFETRHTLSRLRFEARNSKTRIMLEQSGLARNGDSPVERRVGTFGHTLRWGKGSSLRSNVRYRERLGSTGSSALSWSERAVLKQTSRIQTSLAMAAGRQTSGSGSSSFLRGGPGIRYSGSWFVGSIGGELWQQRLGSLDRRLASARSNIRMTRRLWSTSRLTAAFDATYSRQTSTYDEEVTAQVVGEPHSVGESRVLRLDEPFVDVASLVVYSLDLGQTFVEGVDYRVVNDGTYVEVYVFPTGSIADGTEILVDYRYLATADLGVASLTAGYSLTFQRGRWRVFARRRKRNDLGEAPAQAVFGIRNLDRSSFGTVYDARFGRLTTSLTAQRAVDRSDEFEYTSSLGRGSISAPLTRRVHSSLSLSVQRRTGGRAPLLTQSLQHTVSAPFVAGFSLRGTLSRWTWKENGRGQRYWGYGVDLNRTIGPSELRLTYDWSLWRNGRERSQHRVLLSWRRRF